MGFILLFQASGSQLYSDIQKIIITKIQTNKTQPNIKHQINIHPSKIKLLCLFR